MNFRPKTWIWIATTLLFMSFIFYKSSEPYKKQDIKPYLKQHLQLSEAQMPKLDFYYDGEHVTSRNPYELVEFVIRKGGHISEYALLSFLLIKTLCSTNTNVARSLVVAGILSIVYAGTDEWHQTFVSGRTGHPIDVIGPDLLGIILTITMYSLISWVRRPIIKR